MPITRVEAIRRMSELSCAYQHIRMTECPHCAKEVEDMVKILTSNAFQENAAIVADANREMGLPEDGDYGDK